MPHLDLTVSAAPSVANDEVISKSIGHAAPQVSLMEAFGAALGGGAVMHDHMFPLGSIDGGLSYFSHNRRLQRGSHRLSNFKGLT